jgi:hypothetical protein
MVLVPTADTIGVLPLLDMQFLYNLCPSSDFVGKKWNDKVAERYSRILTQYNTIYPKWQNCLR